MTSPLTYWSSGGEIQAASGPVSLTDAKALLGVHLDEARAAIAAGARRAALRALDLATELSVAVAQCQEWRAAAGATA